MPEKLIFDPTTGELVASSRHASVNPRQGVQPRTRLAQPVEGGRADRESARILRALEGADARARDAALDDMSANPGRQWGENVLATLTSLLECADAQVADRVTEIAAALGFHHAMAPAMKRLLGQGGTAQGRAMELLRRLGPEAVQLADDVVGLLESSNEESAARARDTLASIGLTPHAHKELCSLIRHKDAAPRLRCVQLIGALGARAAKAAGLLVLRLDDPMDSVRVAARDALAAMGFQSAAKDEFARMLNQARVERRLAAIELLAAYGAAARPASPLLVDQLRSETPELREAAARALKLVGLDESCVRSIQQLAHHPSHAMRAMALGLLETCSVGPDSAGLLLTLMGDRDVGVRERAAASLARHEIVPPMLPALRKLLRDERWEVRVSTLAMLERAGERARPALRLVVERVEDANADVAKAAAASLRAIGVAPFCLPDIERLLNHRRQDRRLLMIGTLKQMGCGAAEALPLVTARLGDQDWVVREAACEAFIAIGFNDSCLPEVRRLIQHQDREFRLAVIHALGACGLTAAAAAEFVHARQEDSDAEVGRAARRALQAIRG